MRHPPGRTQPGHLLAESRRARVLALRQMGLTYRAICDVLHREWQSPLPRHYGPRQAHADISAILLRQRKELDETVQVIRQQELDRLDRMTLAVWSRAQNGDDRAIQSVLKIMERRARLIPQLEAPIAVAPTPPCRPDVPAAPEDIQAVAYGLAAFGLAQRANGNGIPQEPA